MKRSETLRRQQRDVQTFSEALQRFVSATTHTHDPTAATALYNEVNRASGRAAYALQSIGLHVAWKPPGQPPGYSQPINPAQAWTTILQPYPMFGPDMIFAICDQAIGLLDAQALEAEDHEESFEGKVAHVAGFMDRVRPRGQTHRAGVIQGSVITVVCGVVVGYILHALGWV